MASNIAKMAGGGGGGGNSLGEVVRSFREKAMAKKAAEQGGVAGAGGSMADAAAGSIDAGGSTMGVAPAQGVGVGADPSGADQFAGKKFEISPVQMKGSFSEKAKGDAEGVFGNEEDRNNSLKR